MVDKTTPPLEIQNVEPKMVPLSRFPKHTRMMLTMIISRMPNKYKATNAKILAKPKRKKPKPKVPTKAVSIILTTVANAHNKVIYVKCLVE